MNRVEVTYFLRDLRDRADKPHIWMSEGQWKVNAMPRRRNQFIAKNMRAWRLWMKAERAVLDANERILEACT